MSGGRPHAVSQELIAEAACELFLEQGYERTTVAQIARRAGVSRSSFFNYFDSKSEVFWSGLDERIGFLDAFLAVACPSPQTASVVAEAVREAFVRFTPDALALALVHSDAMGVVPGLTQEMATRQWRIAASTALAWLIASMVRPMIPTFRDTPVAITVAAPTLRSIGSREVPWNGEIPCSRCETRSEGSGPSSGTSSTSGDPSTR